MHRAEQFVAQAGAAFGDLGDQPVAAAHALAQRDAGDQRAVHDAARSPSGSTPPLARTQSLMSTWLTTAPPPAWAIGAAYIRNQRCAVRRVTGIVHLEDRQVRPASTSLRPSWARRASASDSADCRAHAQVVRARVRSRAQATVAVGRREAAPGGVDQRDRAERVDDGDMLRQRVDDRLQPLRVLHRVDPDEGHHRARLDPGLLPG
ncbi:MAG: hypothetical protein MZW92_14455 [Comamonadaceae bacterium]|nr:hypothetical protein [Comamonadaceae bacterium]